MANRILWSGHRIRRCRLLSVTRIYRTDQNDEEEGGTPSMAADGDHIIIYNNGKEVR